MRDFQISSMVMSFVEIRERFVEQFLRSCFLTSKGSISITFLTCSVAVVAMNKIRKARQRNRGQEVARLDLALETPANVIDLKTQIFREDV
jgi:hypothetical protein